MTFTDVRRLPPALAILTMLACGGTPTVDFDLQSSAGTGSKQGSTTNLNATEGGNTSIFSGAGGSSGANSGAEGGVAGNPNVGTSCGNSFVDDSEGCDDGNTLSGDGCDGTCKVENGYSCPTAGVHCESTLFCGDGLPGPDESCDDKNKNSGDGCSSSCTVEPGFSCNGFGVTCTPTTAAPVCGNGATENGETCDDGGTVGADGCSAGCKTEVGYTCNGSTCTKDVTCGNGTLNSGEQCDDGNLSPGDCCNGRCQLENSCTCTNPPAGSNQLGQVCVSTIICGDGVTSGDEACDDGNRLAGDGCALDCNTIESGYSCPSSGGVCNIAVVLCPNARIDPGEDCDDGNSTAGDGCSLNCKLQAGYSCPTAGAPCQLKEFCGNGSVSYAMGEACDDGGVAANDGCSATCKIEAGYTCNNSTSPSNCRFEACGNGLILAGETCDDRNQIGGDGCSVNCRLETGYTCPVVGASCRAICGDHLKRGTEQCDDGNETSGDGCNARCQLEPGYVCNVAGTCSETTCGDGKPEGTEQCDDTPAGAKDVPFDGCYNCTRDPDCSLGACKSPCGDGQRFSDEACDDGNAYSGDGCSSDCKIETGYSCTDSNISTDLPNTKSLPIVVRDFAGLAHQVNGQAYHPDFNRHLGNGIRMMVKPQLGTNGRPAWRWLPFATADVASVSGSSSSTIFTPLPNCSCDEAADISTWTTMTETWTAGSEGTNYSNSFLRPPCSCTPSATACTCDNIAHLYKDGGVASSNRRNFSNPTNFAQWYTSAAGVNLTLPFTLNLTLDPVTKNYSNSGASSSGNFDPIGLGGGWQANAYLKESAPTSCTVRNVSFTTETHFWFEYQGGESFDFSGDDDTWVYVKNTLVVDLGGLHGSQDGNFTLDADTDGVGVDIADGSSVSLSNHYYYNGTTYSTTRGANVPLGLEVGKVYEVVMFQAERNECGSNFKVTLKNFAKPTSTCKSSCGDAIVAADEECDLGTVANNGAYGGCSANCKLAPYCGDGSVDASAGETCDDGVNAHVYGSLASGCGPGCHIPPYCGDSTTDFSYGETCDKGSANSATAYGPNTCSTTCNTGPFCGDAIQDQGEACDDGQNNGGPTSSCDQTCALKCGNGKLDPGEQCDLGTARNDGAYGGCKSNCTLSPYCGDGIKQASLGEACDDGRNDGSYGTCTAACQLAAYCGDGKLDAISGEKCDKGAANQAVPYGPNLCTTTCQPAPYCGDRAVNTTFNELCDDGANNSNLLAGACRLDCSGYLPPPSTCGNAQLDAGEQCDNGTANGTAGDSCDGRCQYKCGNGIKDSGEQCDDGINDGSYGTCNHDCSLTARCGDGAKNGTEQCDLGSSNVASSTVYGQDFCTTSCTRAPYCGDGRVNNAAEQCDGQPGCNAFCRYDILQ